MDQDNPRIEQGFFKRDFQDEFLTQQLKESLAEAKKFIKAYESTGRGQIYAVKSLAHRKNFITQ